MINTVIFDMDGVIIDSEPLHFQVDVTVLKELGIHITPKALEDYVGLRDSEMWPKVIERYQLNESTASLINIQKEKRLQILRETDVHPIEGIVELLRMLQKNNFHIGLASSSPWYFIDAVLQRFGIDSYFSAKVSGEDVTQGKPAPEIFCRAAQLLNQPVEQCMVIEDSRNGIAAAKAAGMKCIGYRNPNSGNQDISQADRSVRSIKEITMDMIHNI